MRAAMREFARAARDYSRRFSAAIKMQVLHLHASHYASQPGLAATGDTTCVTMQSPPSALDATVSHMEQLTYVPDTSQIYSHRPSCC